MPNKPRIGLGLGLAGRTGFTNPQMFDPATLSPYLWNNAENVTKDGSGFISAFDDLAGNGNYLQQPTASLQPQQVSSIAGLDPSIIGAKFDGIDDLVESLSALGLNAENEWDLYTLAKFNTAEAQLFNIGGSSGGRWYKQSDRNKSRIQQGDSSFATYVLDFENSPKYQLTRDRITHDGVTNQMNHRVNMKIELTTDIPLGFFNNFTGKMEFGCASPTVPQQFDGWFFEMLIFKRHLTTVEENNLYCNYFQRKYGV
jgi:hypothetical protein